MNAVTSRSASRANPAVSPAVNTNGTAPAPSPTVAGLNRRSTSPTAGGSLSDINKAGARTLPVS